MDALDTMEQDDDGDAFGGVGMAAASIASGDGAKTATEFSVDGVKVGAIVDPADADPDSQTLRVMLWDAGMCLYAAARVVRPGEPAADVSVLSPDDWVWSKSFSATELQPACPSLHLPATYTGPDWGHENTHFDGESGRLRFHFPRVAPPPPAPRPQLRSAQATLDLWRKRRRRRLLRSESRWTRTTNTQLSPRCSCTRTASGAAPRPRASSASAI